MDNENHVDNRPNRIRRRLPIDRLGPENGGNGRRVRAQEIARKLKSIEHFVYVWGTRAQYYLPPTKHITWHYISQVLAKEKRLLRLSDIGGLVDLPKIKGIVVDDVFDYYRETNALHSFFPDMHPSQRVPRAYFYNVS